MKKPLLYRLFGIGKMPDREAATLRAEGVIFFDEALKGSLTYHDFRAPGRYSNWRRVWFTGTLALTKTRLAAFQNSRPAIDVPLADARIRELKISAEDETTALVAFDAGLFHADWSGTLEYRFRTERAREFVELINAVTGQSLET
ncbi:MAG: hypothetical protein JSS81_14880 [Acidobacteria bacterium]|nr:hypothetical protein [Acidobacteriota bacterium]